MKPIAPSDYAQRRYLSVGEAARLLGISVNELHALVKGGEVPAYRAASGQYRFDREQLASFGTALSGIGEDV